MTVTRVDAVYADLREALLNGEFEPGSKLRLAVLGDRYKASLSVMREAMTRLLGDGFVTASPQRGFRVRELSVEDLRDLTRARILIETAGLRESIRSGDVGWESNLVAAHHTLTQTRWKDGGGSVRPEWAEVHHRFHTALFSGCGSSHLIAVATDLRHRGGLYVRWSESLGGDPTRDVALEHKEIFELALARDGDAASDALAAHLERTSAALVAYAHEHALDDAGGTKRT